MASNGISKVSSTMTLVKGLTAGNALRDPSEVTNGVDWRLNLEKAEADIPLPRQPISPAGNAGSLQMAPVVSDGTDVMKTKQSFEKEQNSMALDRIPKAPDNNGQKPMTAETEEAYEGWKEEITEVLTEKLEVTEEELANAMAMLGITFEDLLAGNGLLQLSMELTGSTDMTELLFDSGFQEMMQEVNALLGQLADQVEMSPEELQQLLNEALGNTEEVPDLTVETEESGQSQVEVITDQVETSGMDALQKMDEAAKVSTTGDVQNAEESADEEQIQNTVRAVQDSDGADSQKEESEFSGNDQKELGNRWKEDEFTSQTPDTGRDTQVNFHTTVQNTVTNLGEGVVETVQRTFVDVQELINQVSEFTRVTVTQDVSRLEMQLNPEHLGKLYMQLTSREGVITAQLIAQNEAVKQALESQVNVLKENMNEQGMKVEAVEVTIASHEFEEHFQDDQQMRQQQEETGSHSSRRFLNLDQLDEFAGQLSEEDSLAAKIMVENGNSVDMTA